MYKVSKNLLQLPANYANISPVPNFLKEPKISTKIYAETIPTQISNAIKQIEERLVTYKETHKPVSVPPYLINYFGKKGRGWRWLVKIRTSLSNLFPIKLTNLRIFVCQFF